MWHWTVLRWGHYNRYDIHVTTNECMLSRDVHLCLLINNILIFSLTLPLSIEVPVLSGERAVMYMCVWGINIPCFLSFSIGFWNCSDGVLFLAFHLIPGEIESSMKH